MKTIDLLAIAVFIFSLAGIFGGLFLIGGNYYKLNGEPVTYPLDGMIGTELGIGVLVLSLVFLLLSWLWLKMVAGVIE